MSFICELSCCHPESLIKFHLSLGWQDYIQSVFTFPQAKEHILFGRSSESQ